jgi:hypothetical protein
MFSMGAMVTIASSSRQTGDTSMETPLPVTIRFSPSSFPDTMLLVVVGKTLVVAGGVVVGGGVVVLVAGRLVVGVVVAGLVVVGCVEEVAGVVVGSSPPPQDGRSVAASTSRTTMEINLVALVDSVLEITRKSLLNLDELFLLPELFDCCY